jgi:hypothetical protein
MRSLALFLGVAGSFATPYTTTAQGVVVDQGSFAITIDGREAGREEFTIRRAGLGGDAAMFANATIVLTRGGRETRILPLLRATPPDGVANQYQVEVSGADALDLRLRLAQRRYVAVIQSGAGEEQREFPAQAATRVIDADVAHQYYFLKDVREGSVTHVLEPRIRGHLELRAGSSTEEELQLGTTVVTARRVELTSGQDRRIVWFDREGRVLRVEAPGRGYVADRADPLR